MQLRFARGGGVSFATPRRTGVLAVNQAGGPLEVENRMPQRQTGTIRGRSFMDGCQYDFTRHSHDSRVTFHLRQLGSRQNQQSLLEETAAKLYRLWQIFEFARVHGMRTYEPRQGRNAATVVCSASAVVTLAFIFGLRPARLMLHQPAGSFAQLQAAVRFCHVISGHSPKIPAWAF